MPPKVAKGGIKHRTSALAKAVKTQRHDAPCFAANSVCVDMRTSAATAEFVIEEIGVGAKGLGTKKASTKSGMKTALGVESALNVDRRIRNGCVPIGFPLDDGCNVEEDLTVDGFDVSRNARYLMPRRSPWNYELSSGRLHFREAQSYQAWLGDVRQRIAERGGYPPAFEQNLQVWRQMWRVLERCDVACVVLDARHPLLHLPPALVFHITRTVNKPLVLVLNKLDMVEPQNAKKWAEVLQTCVPGVMGVVGYSKEPLRETDFEPLQIGKAALIAACHEANNHMLALVKARQGDVDSDSIATPANAAEATAAVRALARFAGVDEPWIEEMEGLDRQVRDISDDSRVMLGLIGHPNVGKSSLINHMFGDKVVSVKATPGHTKTLQTMVLDERTCLCDSPGVVFPRLEVPKEVQIVGMLIPHGQVREPFSAIRWVMEHATKPLHELLSLKPVTLLQVMKLQEEGTDALRMQNLELDGEDIAPWSPMLICAQYAKQRGLVRSGRADCNAAGMEILLRVLEGRVPYSVAPPESCLEAEERARMLEEEESDGSDDDWQVDEKEFESEEDIPKDQQPQDLLGVFGAEAKQVGANTIRSRKKADRKKKMEAIADGTSKKPEPVIKKKYEEEDEEERKAFEERTRID